MTKKWGLAAGLGALAAAAVVGGVAIADTGSLTIAGSGSLAQVQVPTQPPVQVLPQRPVQGQGQQGQGQQGQGTSTSASLATDAQKAGIVTVVSVLKYQNAESAGTGMVLTSDGEVLTNNHVVNGATSVTVTIASTGTSYRADVVGTDPSDDVAVLQLRGASGLTTAKLGNSSAVASGDAIVGVGNAGGTGTLRASAGTVTALNRSITATDETGQDGEKLTGLIEVNAPIISGDSGGPLYNSSGQIVGMDTAASSGQAASTAYAIPINRAVSLAAQIESGIETTTIHIGLPAFIGVGVSANDGAGAAITSVLDGGPAANAGITPGSTITAVNGKRVTSATSLRTTLSGLQPGRSVRISWLGTDGASHTATITLATGPAD